MSNNAKSGIAPGKYIDRANLIPSRRTASQQNAKIPKNCGYRCCVQVFHNLYDGLAFGAHIIFKPMPVILDKHVFNIPTNAARSQSLPFDQDSIISASL
ncbi:MAG: hypothetical protein DMG84_05555 [Acidobacteria bacterium]|nr:MAG: hypothetical protein DMG84_05555 [Acidobacteriota bacterium]